MKTLGFFFLFSFIFFLPFAVHATVFINEIAWMGTSVSANDEWIEIYNDDKSEADLSGWKLSAKDGTPEINLSGKIAAEGFYLLERTDDNTVPGIIADQIYTGALGNNGETIELFDNSGKMVDYVDCSSGWLAGDNTQKKTMERIENNWATSNAPGGTPKTANSRPQTVNNNVLIEKAPNQMKMSYADGIVINEILPSPEGSDTENEWVEIYNKNNEKIILSGWQIKDSEGATTTFTMPENTQIDALGFLIFSRKTTKIILNNDKDGLSLLKPDGTVADQVIYEKAGTGESYGRTENDWQWSKDLTPGSKNIFEQSSQKENQEGQEITTNNIEKDNRPVPKNLLILILTAVALSVLSAIIILFVKKKLNQK